MLIGRKSTQPPDNNMGVLNTGLNLDYLSFTVPFTEENMGRARSLFSVAEIVPLTYGGNGYRDSCAVLDGGRMLWHTDRPEMGLHIRLPSKSLGLLGTTALGILNIAIDWGGKFTRLDIAFDDFDGLLNIGQMHRKLVMGEVVTRWRKVKRITGQNIGDSQEIGHTVNVGSRQSQAFLRIYDKKLERLAKNLDVNHIEHWVRVELELKEDKANVFGHRLAETAQQADPSLAAQLCCNLLFGMIDFKDVDEYDTNKSRWKTSDFWSRFIQASNKLILGIEKKEKTLDDSKEWVQKIVSPTLAMIMLSRDDDEGKSGYDFIMSVIQTGQHRLSKAQQRRLNLYNRQQDAKQNGQDNRLE